MKIEEKIKEMVEDMNVFEKATYHVMSFIIWFGECIIDAKRDQGEDK